MAATITNYRELFASVAKRPTMYVLRADFATLVAFIEGCNLGNAGSLLTGFREWLLTQAGCGDNLAWSGLVLRLAAPQWTGSAADLPPEVDAAARDVLFRLLDEFLELTAESDGLRRIYAAHEAWRAARKAEGCRATGKPTCPRVSWPRAASYESPEETPRPDGQN